MAATDFASQLVHLLTWHAVAYQVDALIVYLEEQASALAREPRLMVGRGD